MSLGLLGRGSCGWRRVFGIAWAGRHVGGAVFCGLLTMAGQGVVSLGLLGRASCGWRRVVGIAGRPVCGAVSLALLTRALGRVSCGVPPCH